MYNRYGHVIYLKGKVAFFLNVCDKLHYLPLVFLKYMKKCHLQTLIRLLDI
jgi:hypothetical protein